MAQAIVSPENLAQAVLEIKLKFGSGGSSDFVHISSVIKRTELGGDDNKLNRLYIAIPSDFDISNINLHFARCNKIKYRKNIEDSLRKTISGWHQILDPREPGEVLFNNLILKTPEEGDWAENWNGKKLYEVTVDGYDSFIDYLMNSLEAQTSGYFEDKEHESNIPLCRFLLKNCGIALEKNGKIISNYARFSGQFDDNSDIFSLRRY